MANRCESSKTDCSTMCISDIADRQFHVTHSAVRMRCSGKDFSRECSWTLCPVQEGWIKSHSKNQDYFCFNRSMPSYLNWNSWQQTWGCSKLSSEVQYCWSFFILYLSPHAVLIVQLVAGMFIVRVFSVMNCQVKSPSQFLYFYIPHLAGRKHVNTPCYIPCWLLLIVFQRKLTGATWTDKSVI